MARQTGDEIKMLQDNLRLIRSIGGWSAKDFGEMFGASKQTISNLENGKTKMSKTQYIAIRAVLDYEIARRGEDGKPLELIVGLCLDPDTLSDEDRSKAIAFIEGASRAGLDTNALMVGVRALLGTAALTSAYTVMPTLVAAGVGPAASLAFGAGIGIGTTAFWLTRIMKSDEGKSEQADSKGE